MPAVHLPDGKRCALRHGSGVSQSIVTKKHNRRNATLLVTAAMGLSALALASTLTSAALAAPHSAAVSGATVSRATVSAPASASTSPKLTVRRIAYGAKLHHVYRVNGTGAKKTESLSSPDDITQLGQDFFVTFQNGVGPQGTASPAGDLDSTIVEFTLAGREVRQWDLIGKCDGLTADPYTGLVIATINEDAHSSIYTINPRTRALTHYRYNEPLPHKGGTDAISIYHGLIFVSASAPGTTGAAAPNAKYPAVYIVTFDSRTRVAHVTPLYYDEALAKQANGPDAGKTIHLALTDPDSNEVVPGVSPRYGGDFMLASQGDEELIFDHFKGLSQSLTALHLPASVDDTAWITSRHGALYTTDNVDDTVDMVTGPFTVGSTYSSVTPCDENSAPATCPAPGFPANYLGSLNLKTGALTRVAYSGPVLTGDEGMIFVP
jgi:hypothetical protein